MPSESPCEVGLTDTRGAAAFLHLSARKVWSLMASGELPCVRIGRAVRFDLRDLQMFVERHKQPISRVDAESSRPDRT